MIEHVDMLATLVELAGQKLEKDQQVDSVNMLPAFVGQLETALASHHEGPTVLVKEASQRKRLRGEKENVVKSNPEVVQRLMRHLNAFAKDVANNNRPAAFVENANPLGK